MKNRYYMNEFHENLNFKTLIKMYIESNFLFLYQSLQLTKKNAMNL